MTPASSQLSLLDPSRRWGASADPRNASLPAAGDTSALTAAAGDMSRLQSDAGHPPCAWCRGPIPGQKRRDARTCSKPCRQALCRFRVGRAEPLAAGDRPRRYGYGDPPYPGLAKRYYNSPEVDHQELVAELVRSYPDGWALSTSAGALQSVLALCPPGVRICIWIRGARPVKSRAALVAWEPVILFGGRQRPAPVVEDLTDVLLWGGRQRSHPGALIGMKSAPFAEWLFRLLGARIGDTLVDLFPGSGAISRAWELYTSPSPAPRALSRLAGATRRLEHLVSSIDTRRVDPSLTAAGAPV